MRIIIEKGDLTVWWMMKLLVVAVISVGLMVVVITQMCLWTINQKWCNDPVPLHRPYIPTPATPQTPLVVKGIHYGNGFVRAELVPSKTQVQWNLNGDDCRQNTPFRVNASTDVPVSIVTDMSSGDSYLAVCMDANALGSNKSGDPDYTSYFGWGNTSTGNIYFDRKATKHDNSAVYLHVGGEGNKNPNHVMIGDDYVMPFGIGQPGQVITVPASGKQLIWSTPAPVASPATLPPANS